MRSLARCVGVYYYNIGAASHDIIRHVASRSCYNMCVISPAILQASGLPPDTRRWVHRLSASSTPSPACVRHSDMMAEC